MKKNNQWKSCIRHHSRSCGTKNWVLADSARVGWLAHSSGYPRATAPSLVFFNLSLPPLHCARCVFSPRVRHLFFSPFTAALGRHCSTGDGTRSIWLLLWLLRSILQRWNVFFPGMLRDGKKHPHGLNDFFSRECDVEGVSKATACLQPDWAADFPEILAGKCGRQRPLRAGRMLDIIILLWTSNIIRRGLYFFCFMFLIGWVYLVYKKLQTEFLKINYLNLKLRKFTLILGISTLEI